jgi:hypothetical protein
MYRVFFNFHPFSLDNISVSLCVTAPQCIGEMLQFAHDTKHEKIVRGIAMGVALSMLGKEEEADALAEQARASGGPLIIIPPKKIYNRIFFIIAHVFNHT